MLHGASEISPSRIVQSPLPQYKILSRFFGSLPLLELSLYGAKGPKEKAPSLPLPSKGRG